MTPIPFTGGQPTGPAGPFGFGPNQHPVYTGDAPVAAQSWSGAAYAVAPLVADAYGAKAFFTPPRIPTTIIAKNAGIPFVPPPDPFGAKASYTPPLIATTRFASQMGQPYTPPPAPYGASAQGVYFKLITFVTQIAGAAGIPYTPPADPYGAKSFTTPPLIPTTRGAWASGNRSVFGPDPYGVQAFLTYSTPPQRLLFGQRGNGPVFPLDPYGASSYLTPPLLATLRFASAAGNRAVFPADPYGAAAFTARLFVAQVVQRYMLAAGSGFLGSFETGLSRIFNPVGDGSVVAVFDPGGGGFGALMDDEWLRRYRVADKWARMKPMRSTSGR